MSVALINKHKMKFQTLGSYAGSVIILLCFVTQLTTIYFTDPNRPGMHMKLIKWLLEVNQVLHLILVYLLATYYR